MKDANWYYNEMVSYCKAITGRRILSSKWTYLACKRTLSDIEKAKRKDSEFWFDKDAAYKLCAFAEHTKMYEGQWKGKFLELQPWQIHVLCSIYGWKRRSDNLRRFRKAYIQVGRKAGKSSLISTLMLYDLLTTPGAQSLSACTKRDTARIIFNHVKETIRQNEALGKRLKIYNSTARVVNEKMAGYFESLASDSERMDGLNPSCCCIDEVASMDDYDILKRLQSGQGSRQEPLIFEISSASDNMESVGHSELKRLEDILSGIYKDDTFFGIAYGLDPEDDWRDESLYIKANPGLGITVSKEFLHNLKVEAMQNPRLEGEFRTRNLGQFITPIQSWIRPQVWEVCAKNAKTFKLDKDKPYYAVAGLDLSKKNDLTAFTACVYQEDKFYLFHKAYFPLSMMKEKTHTDNELWRYWTEQRIVTGTSGSTVDYKVMYKDIEAFNEEWHLENILFDPYNSNALIDSLQDEFELVEVQQNLRNMSPYLKSFEEQVYKGTIVDASPLMQWQMAHAEVYVDPNENLKVQKPNSRQSGKRVDNVICAAMCVGRIIDLLNAGEIDLRTPEESAKHLDELLTSLGF